MTHVIELNDTAVRLADAAGVQVASPGYAVVDAKRLLVGEPARRRARLDPRYASSQFWHRLSTDPVPHPHPSARTMADLAHAHLLEIWREGGIRDADADVIFTIPGPFERDQLALLLGIARECPFRAVGLVDAGVAATAHAHPDAEQVAWVEGLLHQSAITLIDGDGNWRRSAVVDVPHLGLAALREAWINLVADTFIRETRFDPLHDAVTEQSMFDRLDDWLAALSGSTGSPRTEVEIELQTASAVHRIGMSRARFVDKAAPRYALLADALASALPDTTEARVLISASLGRLPGLCDQLAERLRPELQLLADDAVVQGAIDNEASIRHDGEALRFVTELPRKAPPLRARPHAKPAASADPDQSAAAAPASAAAPAPAPVSAPALALAPERNTPTHLLLDHHAWPLSGDRIELGGDGGLAADRYPVRLGTLRLDADGWHLDSSDPGSTQPALALGESRILGPERALVTLIHVERD